MKMRAGAVQMSNDSLKEDSRTPWKRKNLHFNRFISVSIFNIHITIWQNVSQVVGIRDEEWRILVIRSRSQVQLNTTVGVNTILKVAMLELFRGQDICRWWLRFRQTSHEKKSMLFKPNAADYGLKGTLLSSSVQHVRTAIHTNFGASCFPQPIWLFFQDVLKFCIHRPWQPGW